MRRRVCVRVWVGGKNVNAFPSAYVERRLISPHFYRILTQTSLTARIKKTALTGSFFDSRDHSSPDANSGHPLTNQVEMHEALLTKGDVQQAANAVREAINVSENCVLLHPECHQHAQFERRAKTRCIQQLIFHNGLEAIRNWLAFMNERLQGEQVGVALAELAEASLEMENWIFLPKEEKPHTHRTWS